MRPKNSELELLCKELWKHREDTFGTEKQRECIDHIKGRAEGYVGIELNHFYARYNRYLHLRSNGVGHRRATYRSNSSVKSQ